ncbi:uracil-DNA glycosylase [Lewinella cohaerens]|uniref:uracil-DNA glycosylase n=1 Tax=Lewinella cohaerens TaxID=70995 RepID=UPI00036103AF|nr:uracil-DNA glycosylase [Lewinella cohaerens]
MSNVKIEASWKTALTNEFEQPYFQKVAQYLRQAKADNKLVYPPGSLIFNAFDTTPFDKVKVVVLGQDPYHNPGQAMGLSFSVPRGVSVPPSLRNMYKELSGSTDFTTPKHGDLTTWAEQGVFLLNAMLTVEKNKPGSHRDIGWQNFTDAVIQTLSTQKEHLVFLLWGAFAQKKRSLIDETKHLVLASAHPSPFSAHRGFLGNEHFVKTNEYLRANGKAVIDWQLPL